MTVLADIPLRHGFADLSGARLHYVEAGEGPLVILLHGWPEFWYAWREQIPALVAAGFRVVAPDLRGYGQSSRPLEVSAYGTDALAQDVHDLILERGAERAFVVGHDWGGFAAWAAAANHPEVVERLAILNAPHPRVMLHGLRRPRQLLRSWYMFVFQIPWLPERMLPAGDWRVLRFALEHDTLAGPLPAEELAQYRESWSMPGAARAMLAYYRAAFRQSPRASEASIRVVTAPTLVIWGDKDPALGRNLAAPSRADVPNLVGVEHLPNASHWVQRDEADRVSALLVEFFSV